MPVTRVIGCGNKTSEVFLISPGKTSEV